MFCDYCTKNIRNIGSIALTWNIEECQSEGCKKVYCNECSQKNDVKCEKNGLYYCKEHLAEGKHNCNINDSNEADVSDDDSYDSQQTEFLADKIKKLE